VDRGLANALRRSTPLRLFCLTLAAVCTGEILVMALLSLSGSTSPVVNAVFDGLFVTFLVAPAVYLLLVRPLVERAGGAAAAADAADAGPEALRSLADSTVDSIYLVDAAGRYEFVNRHHAARLGRTVEELVGARYADFHGTGRSAESYRVSVTKSA
jgi:PAS domain-containing protein